MKPLWIVPLAAALLVGCSEEKAPEPLRPALFVVVQPELTEHFGRFAGTIEARYESTLGFRVPGRIVRRYYDVGAVVKQGDILANLDPTDQQNQLRSAQGDLAKVQAQLINAQANARRQQELFDRGVGAQAQLDTAQTDLKTTQASMQQAKASVNQAQDQLSYCNLRADHDGRRHRLECRSRPSGEHRPGSRHPGPPRDQGSGDRPAGAAGRGAAQDASSFWWPASSSPNINTTAHRARNRPAGRQRHPHPAHPPDPGPDAPGVPPGQFGQRDRQQPDRRARSSCPLTALQEVDGKTRVWIIDSATQTVSPRDVTVLRRDARNVLLLSGGLQNRRQVWSAPVCQQPHARTESQTR
jgi:membrane fusion protein, multidrug efflux system